MASLTPITSALPAPVFVTHVLRRSDDDDTIAQGYLTKLGSTVKNWKLRWMVLRTDGLSHEFTKD